MGNPINCHYRTKVRRRDQKEVACCNLLKEISGVEDSELCDVGEDACRACCKSFSPTPGRFNSVIASHLFGLTLNVQGRGGVPGCDTDRASKLQEWAERLLPSANAEEDFDYAEISRRGVATECCHFGEPRVPRNAPPARGEDRTPVFECRHPAHVETTIAECHRCRDWSLRPQEAQRDLLTDHFGDLQPRVGSGVARWAVGVTTAPRDLPTLDWCLDSVIRAGWDQPRVFMDSSVELEDRHSDLPRSLREPRVRAWPNYYLALVELLMREPEADAFLLVQDDVLLYDRENLREHLEATLWPGEALGIVSLYCSSAYTRNETGWHEYGERWRWGALAFAFPRELAKRFVADTEVLGHRWSQEYDGCAQIDIVIGRWAQRNQLPIYFPTPSLAQHIGDASSLWPQGRARGARKADRFLGGQL